MRTRSDRTVDYAEALEATNLDTDRARAPVASSWRLTGTRTNASLARARTQTHQRYEYAPWFA